MFGKFGLLDFGRFFVRRGGGGTNIQIFKVTTAKCDGKYDKRYRANLLNVVLGSNKKDLQIELNEVNYHDSKERLQLIRNRLR